MTQHCQMLYKLSELWKSERYNAVALFAVFLVFLFACHVSKHASILKTWYTKLHRLFTQWKRTIR